MNMAGVDFKNPIMPASGTFGSGREYSELIDLNQLGAVVTKGVSYYPWEGNPPPRIMEASSGMINPVGLQNPYAMLDILKGLKDYMKENSIDNLKEIRGIVG